MVKSLRIGKKEEEDESEVAGVSKSKSSFS
jgi:hypothetical protein